MTNADWLLLTLNFIAKQTLPALDEASKPADPFRVSTTCLAFELQIDGSSKSFCILSSSFVGLSYKCEEATNLLKVPLNVVLQAK